MHPGTFKFNFISSRCCWSPLYKAQLFGTDCCIMPGFPPSRTAGDSVPSRGSSKSSTWAHQVYSPAQQQSDAYIETNLQVKPHHTSAKCQLTKPTKNWIKNYLLFFCAVRGNVKMLIAVTDLAHVIYIWMEHVLVQSTQDIRKVTREWLSHRVDIDSSGFLFRSK